MIKAEWTNKDSLDLQPTCNQLATDCISRQAALKVACDTCQFVSCPDDDKCDEYEAMKNLPSADAVEVVRCKDCKHSHMTYDGLCKYCDEWDEDGEALYLEGDFFCAYGEREDGE